MCRLLLIVSVLFSFCAQPEKNPNDKTTHNPVLGMPVYYIHTESAKVYKKEDENSELLMTLKQLDSVCLEIPETVLRNDWYQVFFPDGQTGFIKGNQLADPLFGNLDSDGEMEMLLYGYLDYPANELDSAMGKKKAFVKLFDRGALLSEYFFEGYDALELIIQEEMGFEPEIKLIQVGYGSESFRDPYGIQFLYLDSAKKLLKFHEHEDYYGEAEVIESQIAFPIDSAGSPNQLKVFRAQLFVDDKEGENVILDTSIYAFSGKGFTKVYEKKKIRKYGK